MAAASEAEKRLGGGRCDGRDDCEACGHVLDDEMVIQHAAAHMVKVCAKRMKTSSRSSVEAHTATPLAAAAAPCIRSTSAHAEAPQPSETILPGDASADKMALAGFRTLFMV
jgi:hypothetical protein